jgi:hypothetical protein
MGSHQKLTQRECRYVLHYLIIGNIRCQPRKEREKTFEIDVGQKLTLDRVDANSICRLAGNTPPPNKQEDLVYS